MSRAVAAGNPVERGSGAVLMTSPSQRHGRGLVAAVMLATAFGVASDARGASWSAVVPLGTYTHEQPGGPFVDGNEVLWLSRLEPADPSPTVRYRYLLSARGLTGTPRRQALLATDALSAPSPRFPRFVVAEVRVADGRVVVRGTWQDPLDPGSGNTSDVADVGTVAVFDSATGGLVSQEVAPLSTGRWLVPGSAVALGAASFGAADGSLRDPRRTRSYAARAAGPEVVVAGDRVLNYLGDARGSAARWSAGKGWLSVSVLSTGREVYRLRAGTLRRRARSPKHARVVVRLDPRGGLEVRMGQRRGVAADVRPVWVRPDGSIGAMRTAVADAASVTASRLSGRVLVQLTQARNPTSPARTCTGLFVADPTGTRARRLPVRNAAGYTRDALVAWHGGHAVFLTSRPSDDPERSGRDGVQVDANLTTVRISSRQAMRCAP